MFNKLLMMLIPYAAYALFRLMGLTWRITVANPHGSPTPDRNGGEKIIFAFWHNRLIAHTYYYRNCGITALISQSRDGEYIARLANLFGHRAIRGSTTRNSKQALEEKVALLMAGRNVTITPDGPQGPCYELQAGVVEMARQSGAVIVPMAYDASRKHVFKSWDGFILPTLFARIHIYFGRKIIVPKSMNTREFESWRVYIEKALRETTELAEKSIYYQGVKK